MFAAPQPLVRPVPPQAPENHRQSPWQFSGNSERSTILDPTESRRLEAEPRLTHELQLASRREELFAAFSLVYNAYLRTGLVRPNPFQMRVTPYHLLTSTDVIVAK